MSEFPVITVLFMTKEVPGREGIAIRTIESLGLNLHYPGELRCRLACGQSSDEYYNHLLAHLEQAFSVVYPSEMYKWPPGAVWNDGVEKIYSLGSPIYLRMEDDMVLNAPLDITPFVETLMTQEHVGMIRLGLMPIGLNLHSTSDKKNIYFNCLPSTSYAFSGNPGLIHRRFHEHYGMYNETMNPGEIEVNLDHRIREQMKISPDYPQIWWPLDLGKYGTYGPWNHVGEVKSYETK